MRWSASIVGLAILAQAGSPFTSGPNDECSFDPELNRIVCSATGGEVTPGQPVDPRPDDDPGLRYVYTSTDPVLGDCYYWSNIPGGLDAWDPANDPAVIAIATSLPLCPNPPPLDPEIRAWDVFRSWDLAPPSPALAPAGIGITGLPTQLAAPPPGEVDHTEILPDGRTLSVRATVTLLTVDWGDGTTTHHDPDDALGYPSGSVEHAWVVKTCSDEYRRTHPSGGLCHPTLDRYTIAATYRWTGEFTIGGGWIELGSLDRTTLIDYDVDEERGVPVP